MLLVIYLLVIYLCLAIAIVVILWMNKKSGIGDLHLIGAMAQVQTKLDPEGTVILRGELWAARSNDGSVIACDSMVRILSARDHLLLVGNAED
jgi:membrane-bound serine protease (ClpP class)